MIAIIVGSNKREGRGEKAVAEVKSNVKLIKSGNVPTTGNLSKGQLAFGKVGGANSLYGNDGSGIIKIEMSADGVPIIYFMDEYYMNDYMKSGDAPAGEWYAAVSDYQEIVAETDFDKTTSKDLVLKATSNNSDMFIINEDEYRGATAGVGDCHADTRYRNSDGILAAFETCFYRSHGSNRWLQHYVDTYPFGKIGLYPDKLGPAPDSTTAEKLVRGTNVAPHFEITVDMSSVNDGGVMIMGDSILTDEDVPQYQVQWNNGWVILNGSQRSDYGGNFFRKSDFAGSSAKKLARRVGGLPITNANTTFNYNDNYKVLGTMDRDVTVSSEHMWYWHSAHGAVTWDGTTSDSDIWAGGSSDTGDLLGSFFAIEASDDTQDKAFDWTQIKVKVDIKWYKKYVG